VRKFKDRSKARPSDYPLVEPPGHHFFPWHRKNRLVSAIFFSPDNKKKPLNFFIVGKPHPSFRRPSECVWPKYRMQAGRFRIFPSANHHYRKSAKPKIAVADQDPTG